MRNKIEVLYPEAIYHVYNRANGIEKLFLTEGNYTYFLNKYIEYISPIADTFVYCLMPNHFHFLIRCKDEISLLGHLAASGSTTLTGFGTLSGLQQQHGLAKFMSLQFSHLFNGYTQAINKERRRKGTLFMRPYKRIAVKEETYLRKLVHYIHYNPVESGLCTNLKDWPYSSYPYILSDETSFLKTNEVISWFDDKENFVHFHSSENIET